MHVELPAKIAPKIAPVDRDAPLASPASPLVAQADFLSEVPQAGARVLQPSNFVVRSTYDLEGAEQRLRPSFGARVQHSADVGVIGAALGTLFVGSGYFLANPNAFQGEHKILEACCLGLVAGVSGLGWGLSWALSDSFARRPPSTAAMEVVRKVSNICLGLPPTALVCGGLGSLGGLAFGAVGQSTGLLSPDAAQTGARIGAYAGSAAGATLALYLGWSAKSWGMPFMRKAI